MCEDFGLANWGVQCAFQEADSAVQLGLQWRDVQRRGGPIKRGQIEVGGCHSSEFFAWLILSATCGVRG